MAVIKSNAWGLNGPPRFFAGLPLVRECLSKFGLDEINLEKILQASALRIREEYQDKIKDNLIQKSDLLSLSRAYLDKILAEIEIYLTNSIKSYDTKAEEEKVTLLLEEHRKDLYYSICITSLYGFFKYLTQSPWINQGDN